MITNKVLKNPRVTEKASSSAEQNVYTFNVEKSANKKEIRKAIFQLYKVKPVKVNIVSIPDKPIFVRGKSGIKPGGKKALVYLKKEDKIEFI
jgi:large subunit ribosomal protein L23